MVDWRGPPPPRNSSSADDGALRREIVALGNDYNRVQRQLEMKTQQLDAVLAANGEGGFFPTDFAGAVPRRYSIDFSFQPPVAEGDEDPTEGAIAVSLESVEKSVQIDAGTIFRASCMESVLRAVGTAVDPFSGDDVTVNATLPWNTRRYYFDYKWSLRDTGTDRDWVSPPQPSFFGGGGYIGPLWFPRRTILSGGTQIYCRIDPFRNVNAGDVPGSVFGGGAVSKYLLHIAIIGHQVPDDSAL